MSKGQLETHTGKNRTILKSGDDEAVLTSDSSNPAGIVWKVPRFVPFYGFAYSGEFYPSGTDGGGASAGSWEALPLNTMVYRSSNFVDINVSGQIVISEPGIYHITISRIFYKTGKTIVRLFQIGSIPVVFQSLSVVASVDSDDTQTLIAEIPVQVTSVPTEYAIQYRCELNRAVDGLGVATNISYECYMTCLIFRITDGTS